VISTGVLSGKVITKAVTGASTVCCLHMILTVQLVIDTNGIVYSWGVNITNGDSTLSSNYRLEPGLVNMTGALSGRRIVDFDTAGTTAVVITSSTNVLIFINCC
jgi:alpha-tubulin suppressor-like RCC1 family protein